MVALRTARVEEHAGFQVRLLARLREETTLIGLIDLGLEGFGRAFLAPLVALIGLLPQPQAVF